MEVKLGVTYSPRELVVETAQSPEEVTAAVDAAVAEGSSMLWLLDEKGRRVGVPIDKLAYVEIGDDSAGKRVGFGL